MKKNLFLFSFVFSLCLVVNTKAQVDIKINPIGLLFSSPDLSVEYGLSDYVGLEGTAGFTYNNFTVQDVKYRNSAVNFRATGRYYINPNRGFDKWYIGLYSKFNSGKAYAVNNQDTYLKSQRLAIGLLGGKKWVTKHNIVFDLNLGFGNAFIAKFENNNGEQIDLTDIPLGRLDFVGTFAVGYRIGLSEGE